MGAIIFWDIHLKVQKLKVLGHLDIKRRGKLTILRFEKFCARWDQNFVNGIFNWIEKLLKLVSVAKKIETSVGYAK